MSRHALRRWAALWPLIVFLTICLVVNSCPQHGTRFEWNAGADVVFGQSAAFEGLSAALGSHFRRGLMAAFEAWNRAGSQPSLGLVSYNDGYEAALSENNTKCLLEEDGVFALIGEVGTPTSKLSAPLAASHHVPFIGAFTGASFLRSRGPYQEYYVNFRASYIDETAAIVSFLIEKLYLARVSLMRADDSFGDAGKEGVLLALKDRRQSLYSEGAYQRETMEVSSALAAMNKTIAEPPEAIIMIGSYSPLAKFVRETKKVWPLVYFATVSFVGAEEFSRELGTAEFRQRVFVTQVVDHPNSTSVEVVAQYRHDLQASRVAASSSDIDLDKPSFTSLEGYLVGRLAVEVLSKSWAGGEYPEERQRFLENIYTTGIVSFQGYRLGPYGRDDKLCFQPATGCGCNQGMRQVFGTQIRGDGSFEERLDLGLEFASCGVSHEVVKIAFGQSCALTGPNQALGRAMQQGTQAAFRRASGTDSLGQVVLDLISYDDKYEPDLAEQNTRKLLEDDGVFGLISYVGTPTAKSSLGFVLADHVPFIGPLTGAYFLREPFTSNLVNVRGSYIDETAAMIEYFVAIKQKERISVFFQSDSYGAAGFEGVDIATKRYGTTIWSSGSYPRNTEDVEQGLDAIGSVGDGPSPDVIILVGAYSPVAKFIKLAKQRWPGCMFAAVSFVDAEVLASLLETPENRRDVFVTQVVPLPTDGQSALAQEYMQDLSGMGSNFTASFASFEGYIVGRFVTSVLSMLPLHGISRDAFINQIYKSRFFFLRDLVFGPYISSGVDGDTIASCNQGMRRVYLTQMEPDGTFAYATNFTNLSWDPDTCTMKYTSCRKGYYRANVTGVCKACPAGHVVSPDGTQCISCPVGAAGGESSAESCVLCSIGRFSNQSGLPDCRNCKSGTYTAKVGSSICSMCAAGQYLTGEESLQPECAICSEGTSSLTGSVRCSPCQENSVAEYLGSPVCTRCPDGLMADQQKRACVTGPSAYIASAFLLVKLTLALLLVAMAIGLLPTQITDISVEAGKVVLTTHGRHWLLRRCSGRSWEVRLRGTGVTGLDNPDKPILAKVLSGDRLHLEITMPKAAERHLSETRMAVDTSMGQLAVLRPLSFFCYGISIFRVPIAVLLPIMLASSALVAHWVPYKWWQSAIAVASLLSALAFGILLQRSRLKTPLRKRLHYFGLKLHEENPNPQPCSRGPGRAVSICQLVDLYRFFKVFIADRNMYYVNCNLIKPLTKRRKLSFAELAGPQKVQWFVSHFWGTSFRHFVDALVHHAESVSQSISQGTPMHPVGTGVDSSSTLGWFATAYWICSLSNNQWDVAHEIGTNPADSSFCLALKSGLCKGTAMVLDANALPLTRSWCLFEVLQTFALTHEDENFEGLLLCTSTGVLNHGSAGVDVAMNMAKRLANLKLEDATASETRDKLQIEELVRSMPGGFEAVNLFVRTVFRKALFVMRRRFQSDFARLVGLLEQSATDEDVEAFLRRHRNCEGVGNQLLCQASNLLVARERGHSNRISVTSIQLQKTRTAPALLCDVVDSANTLRAFQAVQRAQAAEVKRHDAVASSASQVQRRSLTTVPDADLEKGLEVQSDSGRPLWFSQMPLPMPVAPPFMEASSEENPPTPGASPFSPSRIEL